MCTGIYINLFIILYLIYTDIYHFHFQNLFQKVKHSDVQSAFTLEENTNANWLKTDSLFGSVAINLELPNVLPIQKLLFKWKEMFSVVPTKYLLK